MTDVARDDCRMARRRHKAYENVMRRLSARPSSLASQAQADFAADVAEMIRLFRRGIDAD